MASLNGTANPPQRAYGIEGHPEAFEWSFMLRAVTPAFNGAFMKLQKDGGPFLIKADLMKGNAVVSFYASPKELQKFTDMLAAHVDEANKAVEKNKQAVEAAAGDLQAKEGQLAADAMAAYERLRNS